MKQQEKNEYYLSYKEQQEKEAYYEGMTEEKQAAFGEIKQQIVDGLSYKNAISGMALSSCLRFGDYIVTDTHEDAKQCVGYAVQIRQYDDNLHILMLRSPDGSLWWYNCAYYWKMTEKQSETVKPYFLYSPDDEIKENPDLTFEYCRSPAIASGFSVDHKRDVRKMNQRERDSISCIKTENLAFV